MYLKTRCGLLRVASLKPSLMIILLHGMYLMRENTVRSAIQELIISTLNIPIHLTDHSNKAKGDLRMAYAKYVALLAALKSMSALVTSGTWTHQTVANDDIIEIFMSKSAYFKNHSKVFTMVDRHPQMKIWLLNADGGPSDYNVWGYQKHTFDVLKAILIGVGTLSLLAVPEVL